MKKPLVINAPYGDPAELFAPHADKPFAQLLDSAQFDNEQGRYSFIALEPKKTFTSAQNIFEELKSCLAAYPMERHPELPPFQGGLLGYFGYEVLHQIENIPRPQNDGLNIPDVCLGLYETVCAFDHLQKKGWIFSLADGQAAHALKDLLFNTPTSPPSFEPQKLNWQSDFTAQDYIEAVQRVIDYIHAGDIFQANLTQRFCADLPKGLNRFGFYQNLRRINPALFSAYLNFDGFTLASSSPERFLTVRDGQVETRPIKGTRPRSSDHQTDRALADELRHSEKDLAENTMIVDLLRNDLSKVCKPHSVEVPELCAVHSFASVHHLVSTVTGQLHEGQSALDLLQACFPGGSITGAPKVRAMEIISELEPVPRGAYCGAIGYIGFDGTMDTNIVIRTALFKNNKVAVQVGGGIVADSEPEAEYQETLDKANALFRAFGEVPS